MGRIWGSDTILLFLSCIWLALPLPVLAQASGILVVDLDRAYEKSKFGLSMRDAFNIDNQLVTDENVTILNALKEEELQLTEDRTTLSPEDFAIAAANFDTKVQEIRRLRLQKIRQVDERFKRLKLFFFQRIDPFFDVVMREFNATAILEKGSVVRSIAAIDITDLLVERVDQAFLASSENTGSDPKN